MKEKALEIINNNLQILPYYILEASIRGKDYCLLLQELYGRNQQLSVPASISSIASRNYIGFEDYDDNEY